MDIVNKLQKDVTKFTIILFALISLISYLVLKTPITFIVGLLFGTLIGILNFMELSKTLKKAVTLSPQNASMYAAKKYFIRFVLTAVVLYVSVSADHINVIGTITGLLLIKVVILSTNLFNDKEYFKNIFRKEE
jgi:ribose/xylose/arabinose/galactoside ABC-type transport system permease subunit